MRPFVRRTRAVTLAAVALAGLPGCGGHHHLAEYSFTDRSLALVYITPPAPSLLTGRTEASTSGNPVAAVLRVGGSVAREVEGRRARVRLDSATARANVADVLAQRTVERAGRYLGLRPVASRESADFLLEVQMRSFGIDASRESAAYLYSNAEAVLLERRTGREIWSIRVNAHDRLTPFIDSNTGAGSVITAGSLGTVSVADFQQALDQLVTLSSNRIADELRDALRDSRK
jgi:ABC-type uncharacterized transport system auxiliary subunit